MLTKDQKNYLKKIPSDKKVKIYPFSNTATKTAEKIIGSVKEIYPNLEINQMGASALGISGQKELDVYAYSNPSDFNKYLPGLIRLLGKPLNRHNTFVEWKSNKNGFEVEFYLTAPDSETMKQQIMVFEILRANKRLLKEYQELKSRMNGESLRKYQKKKYEFYNKILK